VKRAAEQPPPVIGFLGSDTPDLYADHLGAFRRPSRAVRTIVTPFEKRASKAIREARQPNHSLGHNRARRGRWSPRRYPARSDRRFVFIKCGRGGSRHSTDGASGLR
jgi:hypothetical protein